MTSHQPKYLLFIFLLMITRTSFSQEINLDSLVKQHKKIAILPVKVLYVYRTLPEGLKIGDVRDKEYEDGFLLQKKLNDYLKLKKDFVAVEIQSFDETNSLLAENEITLQDIKDLPADFICKALEVDGIIESEVRLIAFLTNEEKLGSDMLSVATIIGAALIPNAIIIRNKNKVDNTIFSNMKVSDGNTGEVIGKFPLYTEVGIFNSSEKVIDSILWINFKNTPYYKK
ncbi:hypothetical protein [Arcicella lustrica]|uniref:Uncharacterized protein n=1 Tax=Arcicella lustrica TaxID=2984196 RepID=A0ABU5SCY5_9BACT|nr:hypothetical protein [Arcicella sp. DC25W]MEA5425027.1 hypothetical protein [Arcicella sp. DC25W]